MGCCYVEMRGKDGEIHATTLDATSLFDAASKATRDWCRLRWFDSQQPITVRHSEDCWKVSQERVRQWREKQRKNYFFAALIAAQRCF